MNKRAMISQPMAGKTDEEIAEARDRAHAKLSEMGYEFVNTLFTDQWYSDAAMKERGVVQVPLCYLAKSLENMSLCHAAYFCKGWEKSRTGWRCCMRISGEERREIVKKLRYTANDDLGGLSLQKNLAAITKAEDGSWRGVMRRLADLIDRPTCRNVYDEHEMGACENGFECSECGNRVEDLEHCCITGTFNCCPMCEREVVE